jgi:hypothetical protein
MIPWFLEIIKKKITEKIKKKSKIKSPSQIFKRTGAHFYYRANIAEMQSMVEKG